MNGSTEHEPVWDLYDEYRLARLNVIYYESQLNTLQNRNLIMEIFLAISTSSVVAGLWLWQSTIGSWFWKVLLSVAAIVAIIKPIINLSNKIKIKSEILIDWRILENDLRQLTILVSQRKKYDTQIQESFAALLKREDPILVKDSSDTTNKKLLDKCFQRVNDELPVGNFYIPEG